MFKKLLSLLLTALLLCGSTSQPVWAAEASPALDISPGAENATPNETIVDDGMPHGLILMTQSKRRSASNPDNIIQVYTIDPTTGAQTLWSQFVAPNTNIHISYTLYGNARSQLNRDYTKPAAEFPKARIGEFGQDVSPAGWIIKMASFSMYLLH